MNRAILLDAKPSLFVRIRIVYPSSSFTHTLYFDRHYSAIYPYISLQLANLTVFQSVQTDVDKIEPPSPVPSPGASSVPAFQPIILETEGSYARRISNAAQTDYMRRKCQQENFQDRQPPKESSHELSPRHFTSYDDHFEIFGRYVAGKLRKSMPRQSIIAEKIIAEVLLRANLGTLEEATCLTEKVPSRCFLVMGDR